MRRTCEKLTGQIREEAAKLRGDLVKLSEGEAPGLDTAALHLRNAAASIRSARLAVEGAELASMTMMPLE